MFADDVCSSVSRTPPDDDDDDALVNDDDEDEEHDDHGLSFVTNFIHCVCISLHRRRIPSSLLLLHK